MKRMCFPPCIRAVATFFIAGLLACSFGSNAHAFTPYLFPSLYANGTPVNTSPIGTGRPLILIHGMGSDDTVWDEFLKYYVKSPSGYKPYSFRYPSTASEVNGDASSPRNINQLGAALRDAMQTFYDRPTASPNFGFGDHPVVILAHSMGGLIARSMMQEHVFRDGQRGGEKVLRLITLGTPHHGTPLADAAIDPANASLASEYTDAFPGFLQDMQWDNYDGLYPTVSGHCNTWLAQLNNFTPPVAGTYGACPTPQQNPLTGYYDKIVAYGSTNIYTTGYTPNDALLDPYNWLHGSGLRLAYDNDGAVPSPSALFDGAQLANSRTTTCEHLGLMSNPLNVVPFFCTNPPRGCTINHAYYPVCTVTGAPAFFLSGWNPPTNPYAPMYYKSLFSSVGADLASSPSPHSFAVATSGSTRALELNVAIQAATNDTGQSGQIYVAAMLPGNVTYLLTGAGWHKYTGGTVIPYQTTILGSHSIKLGPFDTTGLSGTSIVIGYGRNEADMLGSGKYKSIYTIP